MKYNTLRVLLLIIPLGFFACGGGSNTVREAARESLSVNAKTPQAPQSPTSPAAPSTVAAAVPGAAVLHYICPKNCPGSGGDAAGTCPVCGSEYMHNQEYHTQQQLQQSQQSGEAATGEKVIKKMTFDGSSNGVQSQTPPTTEPAQNAAGVWHYTCPNGDPGGGGGPGTCATCGAALAHNSAYHQ